MIFALPERDASKATASFIVAGDAYSNAGSFIPLPLMD
jgi:hypothetical protein